MKRFVMLTFVWGCLSIALVGACLGYGYSELKHWGQSELAIGPEKIVEVERGATLNSLSLTLQNNGVIDSAILFRVWVKIFNDYSKFQAGNYRFEGVVTPTLIAQKMREGDVYIPIAAQLTVPEGFTVKQIAERLAERGIGTVAEIIALSKDSDFLESCGVMGPSLEGFLYPATYSFVEVPNPKDALKVMVDTFWDRLPKDFSERAGEMGLSLYEAVTLASLIELETPHDDERRRVAEVIWRRLRTNEMLGIDAAIIYGIEDYAGDIKRRHLEDAENPYNTRIHRGLPPTPIGSPSVASLEAALNPTDFGYLYYVLSREEGNRHHFSRTLEEHNRYVRKLLEGR